MRVTLTLGRLSFDGTLAVLWNRFHVNFEEEGRVEGRGNVWIGEMIGDAPEVIERAIQHLRDEYQCVIEVSEKSEVSVETPHQRIVKRILGRVGDRDQRGSDDALHAACCLALGGDEDSFRALLALVRRPEIAAELIALVKHPAYGNVARDTILKLFEQLPEQS